MHIDPFSLGECELFFKNNDIILSRDKIIEAMAELKRGLQRADLAQKSGVSDGEGLTKALRELEQCGFIRQYGNATTRKNGCFYQVIDPFVLFSLRFLRDGKIKSWKSFIKTPEYYSWRGNAFEIVCLVHVPQIKSALGIYGVESSEYSWRSKKKTGGAQIDLLIDRADDIINLCEMKWTDKEFEISAKYREDLINKADTFIDEVKPGKAVHITLITSHGLKKNENWEVVQNTVAPDKLFALI